jgi:actin-like ATPase involved in cell morphogenesis
VTYRLGIDLGTTKTAAAIWDGERAQPVELGNHSAAVPSAVFRTEDGVHLFGDAATRRMVGEPASGAVEFKRRVGDAVPLLLRGKPYFAQDLMARQLVWVIERVSRLEGAPPGEVVVTHPANWGGHKRNAFARAVCEAGVRVRLMPEPVAAAIHFGSERRVTPGSTVAVYDLGGGTFDAAVLRHGEVGFEILGEPGGIESLGGLEVDEAVLEHVWQAVGSPPEQVDAARVALLRREVVAAKEHLSEDVSATIAVDLGQVRRTVLIRRSELEEAIRPLLTETVTGLERAINRAGVSAAEISAVVLVGGSSRIPLVQELLSTRLGRPVVLDSQPQLAIAMGAVLPASAPPTPNRPPTPTPEAVEDSAPESGDLPTEVVDSLIRRPPHQPRSPGRRRLAFSGTVAVLVIVALVALYQLTHLNAQPARTGTASAAVPLRSSTTPAAAATAAPAPVGAWALRTGVGGVTADSTGRHTGTVKGGVSWSAAHRGSAEFDGTGRITTSGPIVDTTADFTATAWAYLTSGADYAVAVSEPGRQQSSFALVYNPKQNRWVFGRWSDDTQDPQHHYSAIARSAPALNTWTLLTGVYEAASKQMTLYVNGVAQRSIIDPTPFRAGGPLIIGAGTSDGSTCCRWHGYLSGVQMYDRALTADQVRSSAGRAPAEPAAGTTPTRTTAPHPGTPHIGTRHTGTPHTASPRPTTSPTIDPTPMPTPTEIRPSTIATQPTP